MDTKNAPVAPVVGMPATFNIGSDHYACEITKVSPSGKTVWASRGGKFMRREVTKGGYINGETRTFVIYRSPGGYGSLTIGMAEDRLDPSF